MKVAISSEGKDLNSMISNSSGRAPYYLIFENGKLVKVFKNPFKYGGGGAGFGVVEVLSDEKVELIISGKFGDNMKGAIESKGIKFKELANITVKDALKFIKEQNDYKL